MYGDGRRTNYVVGSQARERRMEYESNAVRSLDELDLAVEDLRRDGYTAIRALTDAEELEDIRSKFWAFFEALGTGVRREDPGTWGDGRWPLQDRGILHGYNAGWNRASWAVRTHSDVRRCFARVWGTRGLDPKPELPAEDDDRLLTSLDGICLIRPPEVVPEEAERIRKGTFRAWPHVDQHPLKRGLDTIQGLVTLYDSGPDDGGLVVYAKSHTDFASKFWLHTRMRLAMALPSVNDGIVRGHKKIKLCGPAGTLFLWDSRTVHCNEAPKLGRSLPDVVSPDPKRPDLAYRPRAVVYVCLSPAALCTPAQLASVAKAAAERRSYGHNVYRVGLFPAWKPLVGPRMASSDPVDPAAVDPGKGWAEALDDTSKRMVALVPYEDGQSSSNSRL